MEEEDIGDDLDDTNDSLFEIKHICFMKEATITKKIMIKLLYQLLVVIFIQRLIVMKAKLQIIEPVFKAIQTKMEMLIKIIITMTRYAMT